MTPGMLRQVIRQAQADRLNRAFDMQARMFVMGIDLGHLTRPGDPALSLRLRNERFGM